MTLNLSKLAEIAKSKPHRPGATEEHIFADNQKARMTAKLIAGLSPRVTKAKEGIRDK